MEGDQIASDGMPETGPATGPALRQHGPGRPVTSTITTGNDDEAEILVTPSPSQCVCSFYHFNVYLSFEEFLIGVCIIHENALCTDTYTPVH